MRNWLPALILGAAVLGTPAASAQAQEGLPVTSMQGHTYQLDWGYVSVQGIFGLDAGTEGFEFVYTGAKFTLGFGSNLDSVFSEVWLQAVNYETDFGGSTITESQLIGNIGGKVIFELVPNEYQADSGAIEKAEGVLGVSGWAGLYWQFFPGEFSQPFPVGVGLGSVENDNLWMTLGIGFDYAFISDESSIMSLQLFAAADFFIYHLERLGFPFKAIFGEVGEDVAVGQRGNVQVDPGSGVIIGTDVDFENFTERFFATLGAALVYSPQYSLEEENNWRVSVGITFVEREASITATTGTLNVVIGFAYGW